jgi:tetratricopeptide (TPR) repeat protein
MKWLLAVVLTLLCGVARAQQPDPVADPLKAGDLAFSKGDYDGARHSFEKALAKVAPDSPASYDLLKRLTSASVAAGEFAIAQGYLQRALRVKESVEDLALSVNLDMRLKAYDRALETAQRIQALDAATYGAQSLRAADDLLRIAQIYVAEGDPAKAIPPLYQAREMRMKLAGPLDPGLLPILDLFNEASEKMPNGGMHGRINEEFYRQALAIREARYGENSSELISTVESLANLYTGEGMLTAAEPLYQRLLALWEMAAGKDHPMVAVTLDKLVVFYVKKGEPDMARDALARSVAIRARFLADGLSVQAADAISENHPEEARGLYNRALVALGPPDARNRESIDAMQKALSGIATKP